jgi:CBS domain-containing protein
MICARDIMSTEVVTVGPETRLTELARTMLNAEVSGVPVVTEDGELLGMVTETDLIESQQKLHMPTVIALFDAVVYVESSKHFEEKVRKAAAATARELMHSPAVTLAPDTPLAEVAEMMTRKKVHHLPVVADGKLVGIVGKADVVRGIAMGE